jgi:hypothetical protein
VSLPNTTTGPKKLPDGYIAMPTTEGEISSALNDLYSYQTRAESCGESSDCVSQND